MKPVALLPLMALASAISLFGQIPGPQIPAGQGVNIHFTDARPGEMEMLARGGFGFVRMDLIWAATERTRGVYDFSAYDRLMGGLSKHGIRALFILDYGNPLYDGGVAPHTPEGRAAFARWAAAAVTHFAGRGVLWEIWNEPNLEQFWKPRPNVVDYIQLASETAKAIHAAKPEEIIVGPASSSIDLPFLEACFQGGLLEHLSAATVHPYRRANPETVVEEYRKLRLLIDRYAPAGKYVPILSGEWGYATTWNEMDADVQGRYLARQWLVNLSCDIPLSIWYDWHDDGTNAADPEHHFGTVGHAYHEGRENVYDPKPAYAAARTLTSALQGYQFNKRLALESDDDWVLLFTKGERTKLVAWTVSSKAHTAPLPASPGRFSVLSCTGEARPPVTADARGLAVQLGSVPVYLTPDEPNEYLRLLANWDRLRTDGAVTAPVTFTPELQVRNVTGKPIRLFGAAGDSVQVPPGGTHATGTATRILRSGRPVPVRQQLRVDGYPMAWQESVVNVANPVIVTPLPVMGDVLPLRIETPGGGAVVGQLRVLSPVKEAVAIATPAGAEQSIVSVPSGSPGGRYTVSLQLTDRSGGPLTEIPARSYRPLPLDLKGYELVPDGDMKVGSAQSVKAAAAPAGLPVAGMSSLQIEYRFDAGWKFVRLGVTAPEHQKVEGRPMALGMWIYSDGSGNSPRMRFVDSTGQCFQPTAPDLNEKGWRYVEFALQAAGAGYWGGAADGIVHYPIRLDTLLLVDSPARKGTAGAIYLASPVLVYPAGQ